MSRLLFQANMTGQDYWNVCVWLPNREKLDIAVEAKATGQELFNKACEALDVKQVHFFGLSVVKNNEYIFIDLEQKLNKYFPKEWKKDPLKTTDKFSPPCVAFFRVQYYVENGKIISDKIARKLYYCHLKEDVVRSHCIHKEEIYFLLAAYALQIDYGNQRAHMKNYFEPEAYFPHWIIAKRGTDYILKHAPEIHKELQGMSVKEAVLNFIRESSMLEDVPVHYYRLAKYKKEDRPSIILGVTLRGIHIYQEIDHIRQLLYDFPWSNVGKLTFLGKKFEIQPDGLPSARKLVYYTGCSFRSQHLLQLLSNSHRLYLNIQPVLKEIKKKEEAEEKKCYKESYVSDNMEIELYPSDKYSHGSSRESAKENHLSRQSTVSHSSSHTSGIEADSHLRMSEEMSVDDPFGIEMVHFKKSCCSMICQSTSGTEHESKGRIEKGYSQDYEVELSVDKPTDVIDGPVLSHIPVLETEEQCVDSPIMDNHSWQTVNQRGQRVDIFQVNTSKTQNSSYRYSQSLDEVLIYQETKPLFATSVLTADNSQSYTCGCAIEENIIDFSCIYTTADCEIKSTPLGKRSMNCLSLDLLGENQLLEYVL